MMNYTIVNRDLLVGNIHVLGVSTSSVFLIGDTESIALSSAYDTPPESLIIGPYVPLSLQ
ncbi:spore germination protein PD [Priestia endophytica DSM 13796]|jgi:spore germination protein PD|uniref:Spore germination protein PD n=2 Tax=Priestia endophytica TaxID=135735 RepID=A0A1I6ASV4_9BACI|nr:spore germination protein PD [Priestia endophytica DSM 13796]